MEEGSYELMEEGSYELIEEGYRKVEWHTIIYTFYDLFLDVKDGEAGGSIPLIACVVRCNSYSYSRILVVC